MRDVLSIIMAGGRGSRLMPLTEHRTKPAVPFGGPYRLIDFTLSNCINSGLRKIVILTQYKSSSLTRHLNSAWNIFSRDLGEFIEVHPPQQRVRDTWYMGTADAIYQNLFVIDAVDPEQVLILSGDHIYKMNYQKMVSEHRETEAIATIAVTDVSREEATEFGVMQVDDDFRVTGFQEKPDDPTPMPDNPDRCLVSMGIYCFESKIIRDYLLEDAEDEKSSHDFGKDVLPKMVESGARVQAHWFEDENRGTEGDKRYWRDVGTVRSFYEANMDLVSVSPQFNLYDKKWPVRTYHGQYPPAKFVFDDEDRRGVAIDSIVSDGVILSGGKVRRSVLSSGVTVRSGSLVEDSIIMDNATVERDCYISGAIIDKNATIEAGTRLVGDADEKLKDHYYTGDGIVVVRRDYPDNEFHSDIGNM